MVSFSQLPAVKKDSKNGADRKFFGPSYFVTALLMELPSSMEEIVYNCPPRFDDLPPALKCVTMVVSRATVQCRKPILGINFP